MSENARSLAIFIDFENLALGFQGRRDRFDMTRVLERLVEKGKIVAKKAYADWSRFSSYTFMLHNSAIELIEIPRRGQSGKNSADIRLCVDAMDLAYSKDHIDTFVVVSGDSDFSPLVSKLKELGKHVIGLGMSESTSDLLRDNCDEFIYYEDLGRADDIGTQLDPSIPEQKRKVFGLLMDALVALRREFQGNIGSSMIKDTIKRKKPSFNESYHGYRSFSEMLLDAQKEGLVDLDVDKKSRTYVVTRFGTELNMPQPARETPEPGEPQQTSEGEELPLLGKRKSRRRRRGRGNGTGNGHEETAESARTPGTGGETVRIRMAVPLPSGSGAPKQPVAPVPPQPDEREDELDVLEDSDPRLDRLDELEEGDFDFLDEPVAVPMPAAGPAPAPVRPQPQIRPAQPAQQKPPVASKPAPAAPRPTQPPPGQKQPQRPTLAPAPKPGPKPAPVPVQNRQPAARPAPAPRPAPVPQPPPPPQQPRLVIPGELPPPSDDEISFSAGEESGRSAPVPTRAPAPVPVARPAITPPTARPPVTPPAQPPRPRSQPVPVPRPAEEVAKEEEKTVEKPAPVAEPVVVEVPRESGEASEKGGKGSKTPGTKKPPRGKSPAANKSSGGRSRGRKKPTETSPAEPVAE